MTYNSVSKKVLMFHRVLPKTNIDELDAYWLRGTLISTERFESIIKYYISKEYSFTTISKLNLNNAQKEIALTFDDGYLDNYLFAKPILDNYKVKATFYPIIGYCKENSIAPLDIYYSYINKNIKESEKQEWISGVTKKNFLKLKITEQIKFVNSLNNVPKKQSISYMKLKHLLDLQKDGHEIGGHSYYHDIYTRLSNQEIYQDIEKTLKEFELNNIKISSYAYTDGKYNLETINALKYHKIYRGCAIKSKSIDRNSLFEIERDFVTEQNFF